MVIQKDVTERSHHKVIRKSFQRLILTHSYSRNTTYAITLTLLELDVNPGPSRTGIVRQAHLPISASLLRHARRHHENPCRLQ